jgi:membrane protease subunit HflC
MAGMDTAQQRSLVVGVLFLAAFVAFSGAVFVDETEHIIITQFGEYKRTLSEPGLQFKIPFAQTSIRIERRVLSSDAPPEEYLTADKKRVVADPITRWRVADPLTFYTSVRDEGNARKRLDEIVVSELRKELANKTMGAMVGNARGVMMTAVTQRTSVVAKGFGIEVVDVRIKHLDLPKEVQQSVFARMKAERERLAKGYRAQGQEESDKITSKTDKEQAIILAVAQKQAELLRGDGDALSTKIYAKAYNEDKEFYSFIRSLEAYERAVNEDSTIVLSTGSKMFRYLTEPGRATD